MLYYIRTKWMEEGEFMKVKNLFRIYTIIGITAIVFLFFILWKVSGDASLINYSGILRGATQKVVKEELYGEQDDEAIEYLDEVLYDLQTGKGEYGLSLNSDEEFQEHLSELAIIWEELKEMIYIYREDGSLEEEIYELSEVHFVEADSMMTTLEEKSTDKIEYVIVLICFSLILYVAVFIFIYEQNQREVKKKMFTDPLTESLNRIGFESISEEILQRYQNKKFAIIKLDIENFKLINTTYDYEFGDELLCELSSAINKWRGKKSLGAHVEADNFLIITEYSEDIIRKLDSFLLEEIKSLDFTRTFAQIKFTYGAYKTENNMESMKTCISKAALAHKASKNHDGNSITWYTQDLMKQIEEENRYVENLEQAILNHEFKLYLQSQVDLKTMEVVSAECLVRWKTSSGEFVFPNDFIPILEKKGLIAKLDYYMLEQACIHLIKEEEQGRKLFTIAVNFSRITLTQEHFVENVNWIVQQYKIQPKYIEIEVTESALNRLDDSVIKALIRLKENGFNLAMDDFGAGYSGLSSLGILPVQILKLDKEFLWEMDSNEKIKFIIISAVNLAHSMGIRVICEGVESVSHVEFLKNIGCEYAQGYYFSRPITSEEFLETVQISAMEDKSFI